MNANSLTYIIYGKEWSWSVVGIVMIIIGLFFRNILLRDILMEIKIKNPQTYKQLQSQYQKRSLWGWIYFSLFVIGITLYWRFEDDFLKYLPLFQWMVIFFIFFVLSIVCHFRAYLKAMADIYQEATPPLDREF
jgi:hypothetical protein